MPTIPAAAMFAAIFVVDELVARGVHFERYDDMDIDDRGIMRSGGPLIAWFADPAGSVLSILEEA